MSENPLLQHMRQESVFVPLPSKGNFYKTPVKLSADGELGIRSMTSKDEIALKIPDALFNGTSIVNVIKSCCPGIEDPMEMPYNDVEVVLLGIRRATYGDDLVVTHKCTECSHETDYAKSIDRQLAEIPKLEDRYTVDVDGLKIFIKPIDLFSQTELQLQAAHQARLETNITNFEGTDEQVREFQKSIIEIANSNVKVLSRCVYQIEMPDGKHVDDPKFIDEWINNIDVNQYNKLMEKLFEIQSIVLKVEMNGKCAECEHPFTVPVVIDQSRFFG